MMTEPIDLWLRLLQTRLTVFPIVLPEYIKSRDAHVPALFKSRGKTNLSAEVESLDGGYVDGVRSLDQALTSWYLSNMTPQESTIVNTASWRTLYPSMKSPTGRLNYADLLAIHKLY